MIDPLRVLLVEDVDADAELIGRQLSKGERPFRLERVETAAAMCAALEIDVWDVILCDFSLPSFNATEALAIARRTKPDLPFIVVSGTVGEEAAAEIMRAGAHDFVLKDRLHRLLPAVEREVRDSAARTRAKAALEQSETQVRQAQKMEAMGELAAGVAHDFNNVLSVILSYSQILSQDLGPDGPGRDELKEIHHAGMRAAELTRQLLAFGRKQVVEPRLVELDSIIASSEKLLRRLLAANVELSVVTGRFDTRVVVNPGQIDQVLMNLVINARDAMPQGGRLVIETAEAVVGAPASDEHPGVAPGAWVVLRVRDTGTGMDDATSAQVFEPFFTTKEPGKGTGLGLSIVAGIVEQSGGCIRVSSQPGRGTTIHLYFPRPSDNVLSTMPAPSAEDAGPKTGDETILLVEDDRAVRNLVRSMLTRLGYQVLEAQGSGDALLIFEQHQDEIDLLLSDVDMPRMSGPELAERLRTTAGGLQVLLMSGYAEESIVRYGGVASWASFVQKPITPEKLATSVREALARGARVPR